MGTCASHDVNGSRHRLWKRSVEHETPRLIDGTAFTPSSAAAAAAAAAPDTRASGTVALHCVAYSSFLDGDCLTGWDDGSIQRLQWRSKTPTRDTVLSVWIPHAAAVTQLVLGAKLQMMYSSSLDKTVAITPITDRPASETTTVLRGHQLSVASVAVDDAEQLLCSGGRDTQTIFWDLTTSHIAAKTTTPANVVTCSTWLPGEALVAQGSEDLSVKLWDPRTPLHAPAQAFRGFLHCPQSIAASGSGDATKDSTYLLTSSRGSNKGVGGELRVWDRRTGTQVVEFEGGDQDATACCFLPTTAAGQSTIEGGMESSQRLPLPVTASMDGTVKVWDASSLSPLAKAGAEGAPKCTITSLCTVDKSTLLASTISGQVFAYSLDWEHRTLAWQPRGECTSS
ncbi:unnamed protein product [Hyaloperonospora brassicae]|uniref:Uncharacterized protein n=1 Tax=Hyaloperonospora brassicae TaxID=162125 RepID=A0AAV0SZ72_HYABA|nr:unnamed protein product [Hyaloperonospora brassicae]